MAGDAGLTGDTGGFVALGGELAEARAAERRHVPPGPSPIADIDYPDGSDDLWRWVDRPQDAAMSAFVARYLLADQAERAYVRACLTMRDLYVVVLFAQRRAFAAIRTRDAGAVVEAFDALSALDVTRIDWRDASIVAMLAGYAAPGAGIEMTAAAARAIGCADEQTAELIGAAIDDGEVDLAEWCGYRVVPTTDGPVLFSDDGQPYAPDRDLAPIALDVAAAIEADGTYRVTRVAVAAPLVPYWVRGDPAALAALENVTGVVIIHATPVAVQRQRAGHSLMVFVVEAATADDANAIAQAMTHPGRSAVGMGIAVGRLCAASHANCSTNDQPTLESPTTMQRFRSGVSTAMR